jgi:formylmethanofuran dehydrogenase subunit B
LAVRGSLHLVTKMKRAPVGVFSFSMRKEADAALIVAADPWTTMPQAAIDRVGRIPHVVIDRRVTSASDAARVHFTTAVPGTAGTAYRLSEWRMKNAE